MVTKKKSKLEPKTIDVRLYQLWLYNDDLHSFDDVIDSLVDVCKHELLQAEQCAFIAHTKGKCSVKIGSLQELEPQLVGLFDRGLTVEIL